MSTDNNTVEPSTAEVARKSNIVAFSKTLQDLAMLRQKYDGVVFDMTKTEANKAARAGRAACVAARSALEVARKAEKADIVARGKEIDGDARAIETEVLRVESQLVQQITADEKRRDDEKAKRVEAEKLRVANIKGMIATYSMQPLACVGKPTQFIRDTLDDIHRGVVIDASYQEFQDEAKLALTVTIDKLMDMLATKVGEEAAAKAVAAEREALARQREEQDKIAATAAKERAAADAKAKADREQADRVAKLQREEADRVAKVQQDAANAKIKADQERLEQGLKAIEEADQSNRLASEARDAADQRAVDDLFDPEVVNEMLASVGPGPSHTLNEGDNILGHLAWTDADRTEHDTRIYNQAHAMYAVLKWLAGADTMAWNIPPDFMVAVADVLAKVDAA